MHKDYKNDNLKTYLGIIGFILFIAINVIYSILLCFIIFDIVNKSNLVALILLGTSLSTVIIFLITVFIDNQVKIMEKVMTKEFQQSLKELETRMIERFEQRLNNQEKQFEKRFDEQEKKFEKRFDELKEMIINLNNQIMIINNQLIKKS